ncbi:MAG TPA: hypothetical protein V6D20_11505 [Candidatus Obscuribacterales bacterium]
MPPIVYRLLPAGWLWKDEGRRSLSVGDVGRATTFRWLDNLCWTIYGLLLA